MKKPKIYDLIHVFSILLATIAANFLYRGVERHISSALICYIIYIVAFVIIIFPTWRIQRCLEKMEDVVKESEALKEYNDTTGYIGVIKKLLATGFPIKTLVNDKPIEEQGLLTLDQIESVVFKVNPEIEIPTIEVEDSELDD